MAGKLDQQVFEDFAGEVSTALDSKASTTDYDQQQIQLDSINSGIDGLQTGLGNEITARSNGDIAVQAFSIQRSNHTGSQSADTLTDGSTNKAYLATERSKLAGVALGATANQTDSYLLSRANHTGFQPYTTITGLADVMSFDSNGDITFSSANLYTFNNALYGVALNGNTLDMGGGAISNVSQIGGYSGPIVFASDLVIYGGVSINYSNLDMNFNSIVNVGGLYLSTIMSDPTADASIQLDPINITLNALYGGAISLNSSELSFFGVTPVIQQDDTTDIKDALTAYGLLQGTSATSLDLDGGIIIAATYVGQTGKINLTIESNGATITTGSKGPVRSQSNCTITGWYVDTDLSTSTSIDVYVNGTKVSASAPITLSAASTNNSTTLTGWTVNVSKGDAVTFNVTTNSAAKRIAVNLMAVTR